jgi:transcription factor WhiB/Homeodomain-like domain-containing protein
MTGRLWRERAACAEVDPELWFPDRGQGYRAAGAAAKRICAGCPVRAQCLAFALAAGPEFGIWAGYDPAELRAMGAPAPAAAVEKAADCLQVTAGLSARQAADRLGVSSRTVVRYRARVRRAVA